MFKFQWFNCINSNRNVANINVKLQLKKFLHKMKKESHSISMEKNLEGKRQFF